MGSIATQVERSCCSVPGPRAAGERPIRDRFQVLLCRLEIRWHGAWVELSSTEAKARKILVG